MSATFASRRTLPTFIWFFTIVFTFVAPCAFAASGKPENVELLKQVDNLVNQLGDDDYDKRIEAREALVIVGRAMGKNILPILESKAKKTRDAEVTRLLNELIRFFTRLHDSKAEVAEFGQISFSVVLPLGATQPSAQANGVYDAIDRNLRVTASLENFNPQTGEFLVLWNYSFTFFNGQTIPANLDLFMVWVTYTDIDGIVQTELVEFPNLSVYPGP